MKDFNTQCAENEALIEAMVGEDSHPAFKLGYVQSFLAQAMIADPELKKKVEERILVAIKHRAQEAV